MDASIDAVRVAGTPDGPVPVVLLGPDGGEDVLPIFIGFEEAVSIARGLDAEGIGRPLTHDLLLDTIEELGGRIDRITVSDLVDGTYIADVYLATPMGEVVAVGPPDELIAAHGGVNKAVLSRVKFADTGQRSRIEQDTACLNELRYRPGRSEIRRINDTSHLRDGE